MPARAGNIFIIINGVPVAQRIRRETTNLEIAGSNPVGDNNYTAVLWCNWLSLWTLNPAIRVQIPVEPFFPSARTHARARARTHLYTYNNTALVAQWIAHWTSNPEVAGSNPVKSVSYNHPRWCSW